MTHINKKIVILGIISVVFLSFLMVAIHFHTDSPKIIMSYYVPEVLHPTATNQGYDKKKWGDQIEHLNILAYAFLQVNPYGIITAPKYSDDFFYFSTLDSKKKTLKKLFSIGGADDKKSFFNAIHNVDNFIKSSWDIIEKYQLSGIDLDFEIDRPYTPHEAKLYTNLIVKLRKKLGSKKIISITTIIDQESLQSIGNNNWKIIAQNVTFTSMMCYDFVSPFQKIANTQFASNLYLVPEAPPFVYNAHASCNQSIRGVITLGVPASKIVLGIPAYGIAFGGVPPKNHGLFQPGNLAQIPIFDDMGKGLLRYATAQKLLGLGFKQHVSLSSGYVNGVWYYHPQKHLFITLDNPQSVRDKVQYVLRNNLAGVMIWRIGQDLPIDNKASLLRAIVTSMPQ